MIPVVNIPSCVPLITALAWRGMQEIDNRTYKNFVANQWVAQLKADNDPLEAQKAWERDLWEKQIKRGRAEWKASRAGRQTADRRSKMRAVRSTPAAAGGNDGVIILGPLPRLSSDVTGNRWQKTASFHLERRLKHPLPAERRLRLMEWLEIRVHGARVLARTPRHQTNQNQRCYICYVIIIFNTCHIQQSCRLVAVLFTDRAVLP